MEQSKITVDVKAIKSKEVPLPQMEGFVLQDNLDIIKIGEEHPILRGTIMVIEKNRGTDGKSTIYSIKDTNGDMHSFWGGTVIDTKLRFAMPGDEVWLKYLGERQSQSNKARRYRDYEVWLKKLNIHD